MDKITLNKKNFIIISLIIGIIACLSQDETILKCISALFILFVILLMANNLEKKGLRGLLFTAGPVLLNNIMPYFSDTEWVAIVTDKANAVLAWLGTSAQINQKTCFSLLFYAFFTIVLLLVNNTNITVMGGSIKKIDPDRKHQTQTLCNTLKERLSILNREEDWNNNNYVPIEAQVEMMINGKRKRWNADLLNCLKHNQSSFSLHKLWNKVRRKQQKTVFLVLGDPGSGKSVALRKLCIDLMDETKTTNRVPVYINLKKWNRDWTVNNLPKAQDLIDFIRTTLQGENPDSTTDSFLDNYFQDMLDNGQWYFIFDSFDELPCLMGAGNNRELIKRISELLHDFLVSGKQNGGIIASRYYKSPSEELAAEITLRIREFDDVRIRKMLHLYLKQAHDVIDILFREREDLVVLCRNPFYLSLLVNHIQIWGTQLPHNQMELYDNFLKGKLKTHKGKLDDAGVKEDDVFGAAEKLALLMQESTDYGLECPVNEIQKKIGGPKSCDKYLCILEYIKLCRRGGNKDTVSFVHRRFQEYLLAKSIRDDKIVINYPECICFNSGLRDALALYCEVADETKAKEIAQYCWNTVQDNIIYKGTLDKPGSMILVNTLYFMVDAFRNRREAIADFEQAFEAFVEDNINRETHFVIQLAMANCIALFDKAGDKLPRIVLKIFELKNHYLNDVVMHNCRLIKRMDRNVEKEFVRYVNNLNVETFLRRFSNTNFALSKAKGFGYVRIIHFLRLFRIALKTAMVLLTITGITTGLIMNTEESIIQIRKGIDAVYILLGTIVAFLGIKIINKHKRWGLEIEERFLIYACTMTCCAYVAMPFRMAVIILSILAVSTEYVDCFRAITTSSFHSIVKEIRDDIGLMTSIVLFFIFAAASVYIVLKFNLIIVYYIFIGLFCIALCVFFYMIIQIGVFSVIDRVNTSHYTLPLRITKNELANNYDKLHTDKWKLIYINKLLEKHTQLEGEWPTHWIKCGERIKLENEDLERTIAMLEYENVTTENQSYNTVIW